MWKNEICCTRVLCGDDVTRIARYLHLTDPYIYPLICEKPEDPDWVRFVEECMNDPHNVFCADNLILVKDAGVIIGVACVIRCGELWHIDSEEVAISEALQNGFAIVKDGYFEPLVRESQQLDGYNVVSVCVDEAYRGQGVGSRLIAYCVEQYGAQPLHLDVVASNAAAIHLYEKYGFAIQKTYDGFSGDTGTIPCYHMIRR